MTLLILFALLAGVATILSPCVLPVLPILLSTSVGGGRWRPLGIVIGLAVSFTAFTLAVAAAAEALALPTAWLRVIAIAALGLFGLAMLVPPLGRAVERLLLPLARLAGGNRQGSGFGVGLLIGAGLGLVWAPCVGPIMASVIALTATVGLTSQAVAITLAYAFGAAVPMLLVGYGARRVVAGARRLNPLSGLAQRAFGALAVAVCLALLLGWDSHVQAFATDHLPAGWGTTLLSIEQQDTVTAQIDTLQKQESLPAAPQPVIVAAQPPAAPTTLEPAATQTERSTSVPTIEPTSAPRPSIALPDLGPAPEFVGLTNWFNSQPLTLASLRGKVVIVDFWTFECYNCQNTMPYVRDLYGKYKDKGLEIVGVHAPEFATERVPENVRAAAKEQGVTWPVGLDQDFKTWNAYKNGYWPAFYFIDARGHLRYTHIGEGNYGYNEHVVQLLLAEAKAASH